MSKSKQKGTLAETAVVEFFKTFFPKVERRVLYGKNDKGDVAGVPNFAIEIKNQKTYKISEWLEETEQERINAGEPYGVLIVKPNRVGVGSVGRWWGILPLDQIVSIIRELEELRAQKTKSSTNL
jgi:hypothetical protein